MLNLVVVIDGYLGPMHEGQDQLFHHLWLQVVVNFGWDSLGDLVICLQYQGSSQTVLWNVCSWHFKYTHHELLIFFDPLICSQALYRFMASNGHDLFCCEMSISLQSCTTSNSYTMVCIMVTQITGFWYFSHEFLHWIVLHSTAMYHTFFVKSFRLWIGVCHKLGMTSFQEVTDVIFVATNWAQLVGFSIGIQHLWHKSFLDFTVRFIMVLSHFIYHFFQICDTCIHIILELKCWYCPSMYIFISSSAEVESQSNITVFCSCLLPASGSITGWWYNLRRSENKQEKISGLVFFLTFWKEFIGAT